MFAFYLLEYIMGDFAPSLFGAEELATVAFGLIWGLQAAYERYGFVHNDLKPENVLFAEASAPALFRFKPQKLTFVLETGDVVPKIIDFGFSFDRDTWENKPQIYMGTYGYVPPDAYRQYYLEGQERIRTVGDDMWAVGKLLLRYMGYVKDHDDLWESAQEMMERVPPTENDELHYPNDYSTMYMVEFIADIVLSEYLDPRAIEAAPAALRRFAYHIKNTFGPTRYDAAYVRVKSSLDPILSLAQDEQPGLRVLLSQLLSWSPDVRNNTAAMLEGPFFEILRLGYSTDCPAVFHYPPQ